MALQRFLLIGYFWVATTPVWAQDYLLEISPRVMQTTLFRSGAQARSGLMPMLAVYIHPLDHFSIGFFGTAVRNYTSTGVEFITSTNRTKQVSVYGLTSAFFIESNLPSAYGTRLPTIGLGIGLGAGCTIKFHKRIALNLIEFNYQNNVPAGGYLFSSESNAAKHAINFESGLIFKLAEKY